MLKYRSLRRKAFSLILLASVIMLFVISVINTIMFTISTLQGYKRETAHDMEYAVSLIDADYLEKMYSDVRRVYESIPEDIKEDPYSDEYMDRVKGFIDDNFWKAREVLVKCTEKTELDGISLIFTDERNDRIVFVVDGYDIESAFIPGQWISRDQAAIDTPDMIRDVAASDTLLYLDFGEANGWVATNYTEVHDRSGNLLGYVSSDINITDFIRLMLRSIAVYSVILLVVLILSSSIISRNLEKKLIVPIKDLARTAQEYTMRDKTEEETQPSVGYFDSLSLNTGDEIETLWVSLSDMERDINKTMRKIRRLASEKQKVEAELSVAKGIQEGMLKDKFPAFPGRDEFDIYAFMRPAREVGGDLYDYFLIDNDHLCMVIGDVSGKGVPAAMFMAVAITVIKNIALPGKSISEIMREVNNQLTENNKESLFLTLWLGIYTISDRKLVFGNAGHEDPAFYRASDDSYSLHVSDHDIPMGIMENSEYSMEELILEPGDRIFLYTDGVPEATRADDCLYGTERMIKCLNSNTHLAGKETIEAIREDTEEFIEGADQFDDMTMLCFEVR
jgi:sigma-B regulation protein RsbU (phosphoserine phosphatase)